jgi:putative hydrolase of the HAD superfamily
MVAKPTNRPGAILLDALGTLLRFEPPAPRLRAELEARLGIDVGAEAAERAMRAEIAVYRASLHDGADLERLQALRRRCAEAMAGELPSAVQAAPPETLLGALLAAIAFTPYPDALRVLPVLRAAGHPLVVVSNWDVSLYEQLELTGLGALVDGAIASAEAGVAKPDPEIFARALALVGAGHEGAWHVGDDVVADAFGAVAAGIGGILVDRDGTATGVPAGVAVVRTLEEVPALVAAAGGLR